MKPVTCPSCNTVCNVKDTVDGSITCPRCGADVSTQDVSMVPKASQVDLSDEDHVGLTATIDYKGAHNDSDSQPNFERFDVERRLGSGGFAVVHLALDKLLDRKIALKVPRPGRFQTQLDMNRFLQEAKNAARLDHPAIVTVHDVGDSPEQASIAMQYIEGESLSIRMKKELFHFRVAAELVAKIADAVHYAHMKGVVHRDLKPGNILLDQKSEPHVVDFGLAVNETQQALLRGDVAGTPAYMAPEQVRGDVHTLDGRADIWGLGVVLYQLLSGRNPFDGRSEKLTAEILTRSPRPPRQYRDDVPKELEAICLKCLSKEVDNRYTTALDLSEDLRKWMAAYDEESQTESGSQSKTMTVPQSKAQWLPIFSTLCVCVLVVALAVTMMPDDSPTSDGPRELIPGVWHNLLYEEPERILELKSASGVTLVEPRTKTGQLFLDVRSPTLIGLGETEANSFELEIEMVKNGWKGRTGFFWGLKTRTNDDGVKVGQFVSFTFSSGGLPNFRIDQFKHFNETLVKPVTGPGYLNDHGGQNCDYELPTPMPEAGVAQVLRVKVVKGELHEVHWNGKVVDLKRGEPNHCPHLNQSYVKGSGKFGVIQQHGRNSTLFRNGRFKLIE